jgi:hypothetical protein
MKTPLSRTPDLPGREWRQLTLLTRDATKRLLNTAVVARDADPVQVALWVVALATTLPLLGAIGRLTQYPLLVYMPDIDAARTIQMHRLFYVMYAMLTSALLAAFTWDAMFPDRTDQEILGVLPLRPRTLAASRLAAAGGVALLFTVGTNLPAAFVYSLAASSYPKMNGSLPMLFAAHLLTTGLASSFVYFGLMALRGLLAISAGERIAARMAIALQLLTVVLFVELFMFMPGILPRLVLRMEARDPLFALLPPVWFGSLYAWLAERIPSAASLAGTAALAAALTIVAAIALSLIPATWMGRRAMETRAQERAGGLMIVARVIAALTIRAPIVRGLFLFGIASFARSRRHGLVLSTYLGLAIATGIVKLISSTYLGRIDFDIPSSEMLTLPLILVFFTVVGLRVGFAMPTDVDANWPFRMMPPPVREVVSATRRLLFVLGVGPVAVIWSIVTFTLWPVADALRAVAMMLVSGVALVEILVASWTKIPFAAGHEPSSSTMQRKWLPYVYATYLFGFVLAYMQARLVDSTQRTLAYVAVVIAVTAALRWRRHYTLRNQTSTIDPVDDSAMESLNLSEAAS